MIYNITKLLSDPSRWNAAQIVGQGIAAKRLWTKLDSRFVLCFHEMSSLHDFPSRKYLPVDQATVGYHRHPWRFESLIISGSYYSRMGVSKDGEQPPISMTSHFLKGSWYTCDQNTWHTVEPVGSVFSVMLIDKKDTVAVETDTVMHHIGEEGIMSAIMLSEAVLSKALWEPEFYEWSDTKKIQRYKQTGLHEGYLACDTSRRLSGDILSPSFYFTYGES